jgi:hypothetical protein
VRAVATLRAHAPFAAVLALTAAAVAHFTASDVIASVGDDSVAYLMLARFMLDPQDVLIREWVGYQGHFPPLFPAILAATGGAWNLAIAHAVVAAFAILSLVLVYRFAALQLGGNARGLLVAVLFLLTPTAWISIRGILSESLFLFFTLWALHYHETRLANAKGLPYQELLFGALLAAAFLLRVAGLTLLVAYALYLLIAALSGARGPRAAKRLLPFLPVALMAALWLLWRPRAEGFDYRGVVSTVAHSLAADPAGFLGRCAQYMFGGWIRSFSADSDIHWLGKAVFGFVGALGIAGAVLRARDNRLDGWYVLATLPVVFLWLFPEDNTRRLLYPLVPLLILHAALLVALVARRLPSPRLGALFAAAVVALPALLCLPAWLLVQSKSMDRETISPGFRYRYADMTDYYTTIGVERSRSLAAQHAKVLAGLESLRVVTPPGASVMWVRPDYIVTLGERRGVPWHYRWSRQEIARRIHREKIDYLVISTLLKSDMEGRAVDPALRFEWALQVSEVVFSELNAAGNGYDMAVLKIDRAALERMLEAGF